MDTLVVIADDFTGAGDTGVQFVHAGLTVRVCIVNTQCRAVQHCTALTALQTPTKNDKSTWQKECSSEEPAWTSALVIDTESRNASPETALFRLDEALKHHSPGCVLYKKTDSTLRGNIAVELAHIQARLGLPVIFAPAFPAAGRTVEGGKLLVDQVPVDKTPMAHDPQAPVHTADLVRLLRDGADLSAQKYPSLTALPDLLHKTACLCCDAKTDEDLDSLVREVLRLRAPNEVVWAGSAGLAAALGRILLPYGKNHEKHEKAKDATSTVPGNASCNKGSCTLANCSPVDCGQTDCNQAAYLPVLALVGSIHPVSREQVVTAGTRLPLRVLTPPMAALRAGGTELAQYEAELVQSLRHDPYVVLQSALPEPQQGLSDHIYAVNPTESALVAATLGCLAARVLQQIPVRGFFVTGGEMAAQVLAQLDCATVQLEGEVESGIPVLRLLEGPCTGLRITSKAGGFGKPESLAHCLTFL